MFTLNAPQFPVKRIEIDHDELIPSAGMSIQTVKTSFQSLLKANEYIQKCIAQKCTNPFLKYKVMLYLPFDEPLFLIIPNTQLLIRMPFLIELFALRSILQDVLEGSPRISESTLQTIINSRQTQ